MKNSKPITREDIRWIVGLALPWLQQMVQVAEGEGGGMKRIVHVHTRHCGHVHEFWKNKWVRLRGERQQDGEVVITGNVVAVQHEAEGWTILVSYAIQSMYPYGTLSNLGIRPSDRYVLKSDTGEQYERAARYSSNAVQRRIWLDMKLKTFVELRVRTLGGIEELSAAELESELMLRAL